MITGNPSSTQLFRTVTATFIPFSFVRKTCACGKQITARQQNQYGKCASCVQADNPREAS